MAHIKYTICEKIVRVKLYWLSVIEDVNKTQICVNIDAFTWHTLIVVINVLAYDKFRHVLFQFQVDSKDANDSAL